MASSSRSSRPRNGYRSPDSRHIPEEDKIMFEKLHDAVGRTKFKIKSLEDEVVSKERAAAREEALRREAERKQHEMEEKRLVDMYGDSGVNEELKERLSPETLRRKRRDFIDDEQDGERRQLLRRDMNASPGRGQQGQGHQELAGQDKPEEEAGKSLSLLLTELDAVKEENRQLKAKLSEAERDLQGMQLQESLLEKSYEAQLAEKGAELIHEIHQAQKERESAVMNRLRLANEERDEALLRCKRIEVAKDQLPSSEGDYSLGDATLDELLDRIAKAETGTAIERDGQMILDRINNTKNRKKRITSEEMRAIIDERDSAAEKVKRLEQELAGYRKNADCSGKAVVPRQNNQEQALKVLVAI
ncbi:identical protein binding [Branchiostoma belcheri]|nr:identical protein binding [Branchiostoma belcheri]